LECTAPSRFAVPTCHPGPAGEIGTRRRRTTASGAQPRSATHPGARSHRADAGADPPAGPTRAAGTGTASVTAGADGPRPAALATGGLIDRPIDPSSVGAASRRAARRRARHSGVLDWRPGRVDRPCPILFCATRTRRSAAARTDHRPRDPDGPVGRPAGPISCLSRKCAQSQCQRPGYGHGDCENSL